MSKSNAARVIIKDDGELGAFRILLDQMGISYDDRALAGESGAELLVTTPRYALGMDQEGIDLTSYAYNIVLAEALSKTMRKQLQRHRFDYVVEQPVHDAALQLLIQHALYRGPERRRGTRVALSEIVKLKAGWRTRHATLVQLSPRGGRVLSGDDAKVGSKIVMTLPKDITRTGDVALRGKVVSRNETEADGPTLSITFDPTDALQQKALKTVMLECAVGDGRQDPKPNATPPMSGSAPKTKAPDAKPAPEASRTIPNSPSFVPGVHPDRRSPRASFTRQVLASGDGQALALIGCDLSAGGMRVCPDDDLCVGDHLKLVLYGSSKTSPIVVKARVLRDDGPDGFALTFENLSDAARQQLETLVETLPVLGAPNFQVGRHHPTRSVVISEVVERKASEGKR